MSSDGSPPAVSPGRRVKPAFRGAVEVHAVGRTPGDVVAVRIETPRLVLRSLRESDRAAWLGVFERSRAHLERFMPLGAPDASPEAIFDRQLELTVEGDETGRAFRRAAFDRVSGAFLGSFNLVTIRRGLELEADASVWLGEGATGRGLAREGLLALVSYSFADLPEGLGLHRIDGWIIPENQRSQSLLSACGFERAGRESMHLTTGDRWKLHERWSARVDDWMERFA